MVSLGLEANLRNLATLALSGDRQALVDFQVSVQYAPVEMKGRVLTFLEERVPEVLPENRA
jgi:hypothetical protein